jgi:hypothetical protein
MTRSEWQSLLGYGVLVIAVGVFDKTAALWMVGLLGVITLVKHPGAVTTIFGGANAATGG